MDCPDHQLTPRNTPEEHRPLLHRGVRLNSRVVFESSHVLITEIIRLNILTKSRGTRGGYIMTLTRKLILISNFRRAVNVAFFLLGDSPASEFYAPSYQGIMFHHHWSLTYEDGTECSETSAYKILTPGNHPKEYTFCCYNIKFFFF